jgi:hypothetical protein
MSSTVPWRNWISVARQSGRHSAGRAFTAPRQRAARAVQ